MQARCWSTRLLLLGLCLAAASCSQNDNDVTIQGSGATFPAPVYKRWFLEYYQKHPDVRVNYQAIGSGAGIRQYEEGLTAFAATDAHPKKTDKVMEKGVFLLPMTAGSIAICYNLPGGPKEVKLSKTVYPRIFLGKITVWNDEAIKKDNPGVDLPSTPITVVHRADSSGTTFAFTNHLNAIYDDWKAKVVTDPETSKKKNIGGPGVGKSVEWPKSLSFLAGRGNAGVAAIIQLTPGAIGYTETSYAELAKLSIAQLQNKEGEFKHPTPKTNLAALSGSNLKSFFDKNKQEDGYHIEITNPDGTDAYPIVTYTWMMVSRKYKDERIGNALKHVLVYCLNEGQDLSPEIGYIPLPRELAERVLATVRKIEVGK